MPPRKLCSRCTARCRSALLLSVASGLLQVDEESLVFGRSRIRIIDGRCQVIDERHTHAPDKSPVDGNPNLIDSAAVYLERPDSFCDQSRSFYKTAGRSHSHYLPAFNVLFLRKLLRNLNKKVTL